MTYQDVFRKFFIEYDKDSVTSSYPSLTDYEIATLLDKAYLALVAQKVTGNNPRQVAFDGDIKAIEDLQSLINSVGISASPTGNFPNEIIFDIPNPGDFLYFISAAISCTSADTSLDGPVNSRIVQIVGSNDVDRFKATRNNVPWIKDPVCCIQDNIIHVFVDLFDINSYILPRLTVTYIEKKDHFVDAVDNETLSDTVVLSDSMVEELINLAIIMATENVESPRLTTKVQTRQLES